MTTAVATVYESIVEEIDAVCTERIFNARSERLMLYHDVGRILKEKEDEGFKVTDLIQKLSADERLKGKEMGERNLWFAHKLYRTYPDVGALPDGKNCSVNKMKLLLSGPKEEKPINFEEIAGKIHAKYGADTQKIYYYLGEILADEALRNQAEE